AHRWIDDQPTRRIFQEAALAAAAFFRRASLHEDERGRALLFAARFHDSVQFVPMGDLYSRRNVVRLIMMRIFRDQIDLSDAFSMQLERNLLRGQIAIMTLSASHRDRVVIEDLVCDICFRGDRLADRQDSRMKIGAVAEISENMFFVSEWGDADPRHALTAHMGEG